MSPLSILFNCIILSVVFKEAFSMPKNLSILTILPNETENIDRSDCLCTRNLFKRGAPVRDDYKYTPGIGSYKLHTRAKVWNEARKICNEEGGHLAIINSIAEANVLTDIFCRAGPVKGSSYPYEAFLGIHDLYAEGDWTTVHGQSLAQTGYSEWSNKWNGQPDNWAGKQHCGALLNEGTMDDVRCDEAFAFFCEIPDV